MRRRGSQKQTASARNSRNEPDGDLPKCCDGVGSAVSTRETSRRRSEADSTRIPECLLLSSTLSSEVNSFRYGASTREQQLSKAPDPVPETLGAGGQISWYAESRRGGISLCTGRPLRRSKAGRIKSACSVRNDGGSAANGRGRKMPGFPTQFVGTPTNRGKARRYVSPRRCAEQDCDIALSARRRLWIWRFSIWAEGTSRRD
jgi:hypothetical protein